MANHQNGKQLLEKKNRKNPNMQQISHTVKLLIKLLKKKKKKKRKRGYIESDFPLKKRPATVQH